MKVVFKKLEEIENIERYPVITNEMKHLFDGKTVREVYLGFAKNGKIFTFDDGENYFLIHKLWIKEE